MQSLPMQYDVTVVICTRNREERILSAVSSVLANDNQRFSLLVIDQSDGDRTRRALDPVKGDTRLRIVSSSERGLSRARNQALRLAETELVLFTDDDCEVPSNWVADFVSSLEGRPSVAVAFCPVVPGPHDESAGYVPNFECSGTRVLSSIADLSPQRGMGAGFAVRRSAALELGAFDEELGAGGSFPAAEDCDIAVRALLNGYEVMETDATFVIHHGFRSWLEGRALARRDWVGLGAAYSKPLRAGYWTFGPVLARELLVNVAWPPLRDILNLRRPKGLGRIAYFASGIARGFMAPFDPRSVVFLGADQLQGADQLGAAEQLSAAE
ncbi:MAG TPA: glycosyltransferase family A protein [Polyangiaceae bacterium]|nr:glycosyltransferase family A protein [Polyangiaceae bacterium]